MWVQRSFEPSSPSLFEIVCECQVPFGQAEVGCPGGRCPARQPRLIVEPGGRDRAARIPWSMRAQAWTLTDVARAGGSGCAGSRTNGARTRRPFANTYYGDFLEREGRTFLPKGTPDVALQGGKVGQFPNTAGPAIATPEPDVCTAARRLPYSRWRGLHDVEVVELCADRAVALAREFEFQGEV